MCVCVWFAPTSIQEIRMDAQIESTREKDNLFGVQKRLLIIFFFLFEVTLDFINTLFSESKRRGKRERDSSTFLSGFEIPLKIAK